VGHWSHPLHQVGAQRVRRCPRVARPPTATPQIALVFRGFRPGGGMARNLQILIPEAGGNGR